MVWVDVTVVTGVNEKLTVAVEVTVLVCELDTELVSVVDTEVVSVVITVDVKEDICEADCVVVPTNQKKREKGLRVSILATATLLHIVRDQRLFLFLAGVFLKCHARLFLFLVL